MAASSAVAAKGRLPNVVIIFIDDMGYADIGAFGHPWGYTTPNLDRLAKEGIRFTDWYDSDSVCTASRAALLTGCYNVRVGLHGALWPHSKVGISDQEMTMAQMFKQKNYATAIFGKWGLGDAKQFLPTHHGFDEYFGLPYSNDMWPYHPTLKGVFPPLPMIEGDKVVISNVTSNDQAQLTRWYTEHAVKFIQKNKHRPFFLYVPHSMCHVPLFASDKFKGKTKRGIFGDVIEELDWSVGEILKAIRESGLDDNTLVIFSSDNGPWLSYGDHAGSAFPLREGKGTSWEGGVRVPFIARWPGKIPPNSVCRVPAMSIDLLPTFARMIGAKLPKHKIDGLDIWPLLSGDPHAKSPHKAFYIYHGKDELHAVISGSGHWKLVFPHEYRTLGGQPGGTGGMPVKYRYAQAGLELYHLYCDKSESVNVIDEHPDVVKRLEALADKCREDLGDSLRKIKGSGQREPGRLAKNK